VGEEKGESKNPLFEDLHVSGLLDQAGHFSLLHRSKPSVLAGKDLACVCGIFSQGITVHEGVVLRVFTLGRCVCRFAHKGSIMNVSSFESTQKFVLSTDRFSLTKLTRFDFLIVCHESSIIY
jgi:hypothetical protein